MEQADDFETWEAIITIILAVPVVWALFAIYFTPYFIANARDHKNKRTIFILNIPLGITFFGWFVLAFWAITTNE